MNGNGDNGTRVRPDGQTKKVVGLAYTFSMAVVGFLAMQVWLMNERMGRIEEKQAADAHLRQVMNRALQDRLEAALVSQSQWNERIERLLERLSEKMDALKREGR